MQTTARVLLAALMLFVNSFPAFAGQYVTYRPFPVEIVHVDKALLNEIVPFVRPYVAQQGHMAPIHNTDMIVIADHPTRIAIIREELAGLTAKNFNGPQLRVQLDKRIRMHPEQQFVTQVITLQHIDPTQVMIALRVLLQLNGSLIPRPESKSLEICDNPQTVADFVALVKELDEAAAPAN